MRVLLHTCCGPCASHCIFALREKGCDVTLFFSNANIAPPEEFERRLEAARVLAYATSTPLVVDEPDHGEWLKTVATGFEGECEGGKRCERCFRYSLRRTADAARAGGYDGFATSLTVSPHKRSETVFEAGREAGGDLFMSENFKKKNGFLHSLELARRYGLYRQNYCGCEFSMRQSPRS